MFNSSTCFFVNFFSRGSWAKWIPKRHSIFGLFHWTHPASRFGAHLSGHLVATVGFYGFPCSNYRCDLKWIKMIYSKMWWNRIWYKIVAPNPSFAYLRWETHLTWKRTSFHNQRWRKNVSQVAKPLVMTTKSFQQTTQEKHMNPWNQYLFFPNQNHLTGSHNTYHLTHTLPSLFQC